MQAYLGFDICNKMQALKTVKKTLETPKDYKKQSQVKRFEKERNNGDERRSEWVGGPVTEGPNFLEIQNTKTK